MSGRARIVLDPQACTSCMLCVRECPTWCITLEAHQEAVTPPGARRPRIVNVLDQFTIDFGLCMFCGICVDVCPFDALAWRAEAVSATCEQHGLRHGIDLLAP